MRVLIHNLFEHIAESVPQMVWVTDAAGRTEYVNRQWTEFTGLDLAATLEKGWAWPIHPDDVSLANESWSKPHRLGEPLECEVRYRSVTDGSYRHYLVRAVPLKDEFGQIKNWLGTSTDVHEQKLLLQQVNDALATRDEFLSIASHELKTPLTSLNLQLQVLSEMIRKKKGSLDHDVLLKNLATCEGQSERLTGLLDDLLDLTRIRSGQLQLTRANACLIAIVHDVLSRSESEILNSGSQISVEIAPDIQGDWDEARIGQVLSNLISNALKYGEGKPIVLSARASLDRKSVVLQIQDGGQGIAAEEQEKIFKRFERVISDKKVPGLGLGLYIVSQIVQAHGGKVHVHSQLGQGSTFTVELPAKRDR